MLQEEFSIRFFLHRHPDRILVTGTFTPFPCPGYATSLFIYFTSVLASVPAGIEV